ncbi:MAG: metabolite traffic protein EboE [Verrucomicrobiales bacterium]|nr:metabolite traffic protein EboE [Verrucomicrobiales bacterium]
MRLTGGKHLAYCTNIHRGETWSETLANLETHTLRVRDQVCPGEPYAIGLRLGAEAARELSDPATLAAFRRWLDHHDCYVFTINGFPYGRFHGTRVKEQVYAPDWTTEARVAYTNLLFDLLAEMVPAGVGGSVSTVPCSFKDFIKSPEQEAAMRRNLVRCVDHMAELSERTGRELHLGLEPEPRCFVETTGEVLRFFEKLRSEHPGDDRLTRHLGVNYDTCHLAVEFEEARESLDRLRAEGVRISKLHLSSALKVRFSEEARAALSAFNDPVYFHQVVARPADGSLARFNDLPDALADATAVTAEEWRVHYHVPLHAQLAAPFETTADHLQQALDFLREHPELCDHFEMETYTWEVLPPELRARSVVEQLVAEHRWTLGEFAKRGFARC